MMIFERIIRITLVVVGSCFVFLAGLAIGFENGYDFGSRENSDFLRFSGGTVYAHTYAFAVQAAILSFGLFIMPLGKESRVWFAIRFLLVIGVWLTTWSINSTYAGVGASLGDPFYATLRYMRVYFVSGSLALTSTFLAEILANVRVMRGVAKRSEKSSLLTK